MFKPKLTLYWFKFNKHKHLVIPFIIKKIETINRNFEHVRSFRRSFFILNEKFNSNTWSIKL